MLCSHYRARSLLLALGLSLPLVSLLEGGISTMGLAAPKYTPPRTAPYRAPKRTQGTGSRGCDRETLPVTLSLLVPSDHTGRTTAGHPTLFWHLSRAVSVPIALSVVEPGQPKPLFETELSSSSAGIMQLTLPDTAPELVVGKSYRWSVSLRCLDRRSADIFAQAWIERADIPATVKAQLDNASQPNQKAEIYAKEGFWFDALALLSPPPPDPQKIAQMERDRQELLKQIGFDAIVFPPKPTSTQPKTTQPKTTQPKTTR